MSNSLEACKASWTAYKKHDLLIMCSEKLMDFLSIHFLIYKYFGFEIEEASNSIVLHG